MPKNRTIIVPLSGVIVGSDFSEEFSIDRVTVISRAKISRLQSRFGISRTRWKRLRESGWSSEFRDDTTSFAIIRDSSTKSDADVAKIIEEELHILQIIQLPLSGEALATFAAVPEGRRFSLNQKSSFYKLEASDSQESWGASEVHDGVVFPLTLDFRYVSEDQRAVFKTISKALRSKAVSSKWKLELRRAMQLLGRSITERWTDVAFLLACISIETLLITDQEKHSEQLARGVFLFSGPATASRGITIREQFDAAYKKRCAFVHRGQADDISMSDTRVAQEIAFNIIANICSNLSTFSNREEVVRLSKQVEAAHLLGLEKKFWPRRMLYRSCITEYR